MNFNNNILAPALQAFRETTGMTAELVSENEHALYESGDAEIILAGLSPFVAEIKKTVRPATLGAVLANIKRLNRPGILITDYVTPQVAAILKEKGIPFLDVAGNVYLKTPNVFIYVVGRKKPKDFISVGKNRAFRASGLKVIFSLITLDGLLKAPTREIAYNAGVANGTVSNIIQDLEQLGFIYRSKTKGLVIENWEKLIDNWVEAFPRELRPQLKRQRFNILHLDWWKEFTYDRWQKNQMWLGGEPAAALLTQYLYPEKITVYGRPDFTKLAKIIKMPQRDEKGNFELLEPFWNFETDKLDEVHRLCPPLLIYADLVATNEARHLDAAYIVREKYLHGQ